MKTRNGLLALVLCFFIGNITAQQKTAEIQLPIKKEQSRIANLVHSKSFEFIANTMYPLGQSPKNLVGSNYSVTFSPETIISNMPFYGRAYRATISGKDKGMRFKGAAEDLKIAETDKGYEVNVTVKNENDTYTLLLNVSDSGFATLSITTNNRGAITYHGEIIDNE